MIITEYLFTRRDGVVLNITRSDAGMYIERDGVLYVDAVDPADSGRAYTETNIPIPAPEEPDPEEDAEEAETNDENETDTDGNGE